MQTSILLCLCTGNHSIGAETHSHGEQETKESIAEARRLELLNWPVHKGKKSVRYKQRHKVIVDLNQTHVKVVKGSELSSTQLDEIYSYIADRVLDNEDFAIRKSEMLDNNQVRIYLAVPESKNKLNLKTDEFIIGVGDSVQRSYGSPDMKFGIPEYAKSDEWDKESGIEALRVKFNGGETYAIATLFFDSLEGFKETFALMRGSARYTRAFKYESGEYAREMAIGPDDIKHLEASEHLVKVVPSPYKD